MNWGDMNYWKQFNIKSKHYMNRYINFIKSIQNKGKRNLEYIERHHIVPKSFVENCETVELTPREHFIAHYILTRCFYGTYKRNMIFAFKFFVNKNRSDYYKISSVEYDYSKRIRSEYERSKVISENTRKKMSINHADISGLKHPRYGKGYLVSGNKNPMYGKHHTKETKDKISKTRNSRREEYKKKNSYSRNVKGERNPMYGKKRINNGIINKTISSDELGFYISKGWKTGTIKVKNKYLIACDLAEAFPLADPEEVIEVGELVEVDPATNKYRKCQERYSKYVVGVCSDSYGQLLGGDPEKPGDLTGFVPVGLAGRVKVKVTGLVCLGDLLTSSHIPGVAMAVEYDRAHPGTVIGKCVEMTEKEDEVIMLISNQ